MTGLISRTSRDDIEDGELLLESEPENEPEKSVSDISLLARTIRKNKVFVFCGLRIWVDYSGAIPAYARVPRNKPANFRDHDLAQQFLGEVLHMSDEEDEAGGAPDDDGSSIHTDDLSEPELDDFIRFDSMGMMMDSSQEAHRQTVNFPNDTVDATRTKVCNMFFWVNASRLRIKIGQ